MGMHRLGGHPSLNVAATHAGLAPRRAAVLVALRPRDDHPRWSVATRVASGRYLVRVWEQACASVRMLIVAEPQLGWPGKWEEREAIRAAHVRAVGDRFCKCLHRIRKKPATGERATDANVTEVVTGRRARGALPRWLMLLVHE